LVVPVERGRVGEDAQARVCIGQADEELVLLIERRAVGE
jgi:hypothetical protein